MRTSSRAAAVLAGSLAASLVLSAAPAVASDPAESTITGPKKPGAATSSWTGSIANPGAELAAAFGATDDHHLTLAAPGKGKKAAKYFEKNSATLDVLITWDGAYNDLDLRVFDPNGAEVAIDGAFATESETVSVPITMPGTYRVEVTSYLAEPGIGYDALATLTMAK